MLLCHYYNIHRAILKRNLGKYVVWVKGKSPILLAQNMSEGCSVRFCHYNSGWFCRAQDRINISIYIVCQSNVAKPESIRGKCKSARSILELENDPCG